MVPMAGLEPARLAPLPPQDSVSTNSTTSACFNNHFYSRFDRAASAFSLADRRSAAQPRRRPAAVAGRLRARRRHGRIIGRRQRGRADRLGARARHGETLHRAALFQARCGRWLRQIRQRQAGHEEQRRQHARHRDRNDAEPRAPNTVPEAPAPKRRAGIGALASLQQHQADDGHRQQHVHDQKIAFATSSLPTVFLKRFARAAQMRQELLGLQRRAADQAAVDIGHREQLVRVRRLDAAAVQDRTVPGSALGGAAQAAARMCACLPGACAGARRLAGADRPDRLVGDHGARQRLDAGGHPAPHRAGARPPRCVPASRSPASRRRTASASGRRPAPRRTCAPPASSVSP